MLNAVDGLIGRDLGLILMIGGVIILLVLLFVLAALVYYVNLWLPAYMANADVRLLSLVGMTFRQIRPSTIVAAKIMGTQAGLNIDRHNGMTTAHLEAHTLAGGDVMQVVRAIIVAERAGMTLDFSRAAAIDLAGRGILDAVRISVSPKVIECPDTLRNNRSTLSAVAKNGVEVCVHARVTVRTNLDQLVGGATEETIIARVGQGIISVIGAAATHMEVMATPDRISKNVMARGLDADTAYEIVSIDIAQIDIGANIGARLQADQAEADLQVARAHAESRRAAAIASQQEMKAEIAASQAGLILAEAEVPAAMAEAFRAGKLYISEDSQSHSSRWRYWRDSPYSSDLSESHQATLGAPALR